MKKVDKIVVISDIKKIEKVLKKWSLQKKFKEDRKILKPKFQIIFIYCERNGKICSYLYAYDLEDGYFRTCILDDLDTGKKLNRKYAEKMIKSLISYCKKEDLDICVTIGKFEYGNSELILYKNLGFKINKKQRVMEYST